MPAGPAKICVALLMGAAVLLLADSAFAQSTGRSILSRPGSLYRQGLPPATMYDSTGRSPGSLSPRVTTPGAPYIIPPAKPGTSADRLRARLPAPRQRVTD